MEESFLQVLVAAGVFCAQRVNLREKYDYPALREMVGAVWRYEFAIDCTPLSRWLRVYANLCVGSVALELLNHCGACQQFQMRLKPNHATRQIFNLLLLGFHRI